MALYGTKLSTTARCGAGGAGGAGEWVASVTGNEDVAEGAGRAVRAAMLRDTWPRRRPVCSPSARSEGARGSADTHLRMHVARWSATRRARGPQAPPEGSAAHWRRPERGAWPPGSHLRGSVAPKPPLIALARRSSAASGSGGPGRRDRMRAEREQWTEERAKRARARVEELRTGRREVRRSGQAAGRTGGAPGGAGAAAS